MQTVVCRLRPVSTHQTSTFVLPIPQITLHCQVAVWPASQSRNECQGCVGDFLDTLPIQAALKCGFLRCDPHPAPLRHRRRMQRIVADGCTDTLFSCSRRLRNGGLTRSDFDLPSEQLANPRAHLGTGRCHAVSPISSCSRKRRRGEWLGSRNLDAVSRSFSLCLVEEDRSPCT